MELINELIIKNVDEDNLIKKWKRKHNDNIALYFFNKYKDEVLTIVYHKINTKFSSIPIEKNDLFNVVWKSILHALKYYDFEKNVKIKSLIIKKAYQLSIREAIKFLNNSQLVMNTAYSYDKLFEVNKNFNLGKNGSDFINTSYTETTKCFIEEVVAFNEEFDINLLKQVIYLRSLGHSVNDICKKLNLPIRYVKKMIDFACDIARKMF